MSVPDNPAAPTRHIYLVRHYKPQIARTGLFDRIRATQFITDYDAAGIEVLPSARLDLPFSDIKRVHTSALPRAIQTAQALFGPEVELKEDKIFNECERKILALPLLRFPIRVWLAGARLLWLLGLNSQGIENYREARTRAKQCAQKLAQYAEVEQKMVLVAHGMLNIFIRQFLRKMGWQVVRQNGHGYLSVTELVKYSR